MKSILNDMPLFVEVAKQKSFTAAADILEIPVSTLSRRIAAMEKTLGVPLLLRNSRNVELTESGKSFYEQCDYIVENAMNACEALVQNINTPSGPVRLSTHIDSYTFILPGLRSFATLWPHIQLHINFSDRCVDLLTEPYDLDIRTGPLPDSSLVSRKLTSAGHAVYASPKLFESFSLPKKPEDLLQLPNLVTSCFGNTLTFQKKGKTRTIILKAAHSFNSLFATLNFTLDGHGVACIPKPLAFRHEKEGSLIKLLPDWDMPIADIFIIMANHQMPLRVRLLTDHLVSYAKQVHQEISDEMNNPNKPHKRSSL